MRPKIIWHERNGVVQMRYIQRTYADVWFAIKASVASLLFTGSIAILLLVLGGFGSHMTVGSLFVLSCLLIGSTSYVYNVYRGVLKNRRLVMKIILDIYGMKETRLFK